MWHMLCRWPQPASSSWLWCAQPTASHTALRSLQAAFAALRAEQAVRHVTRRQLLPALLQGAREEQCMPPLGMAPDRRKVSVERNRC